MRKDYHECCVDAPAYAQHCEVSRGRFDMGLAALKSEQVIEEIVDERSHYIAEGGG